MRYTASMLMLLLLVVGTASWAACPGGCPITRPAQIQCPVACPAPVACPKPCPTACPKPCPAPVCPSCPGVPAAIGAGPALGLEGLQCPAFDPAYAQSMFEQNSVIIAVTEYGARTAQDRNLRAISREINGYLKSANNKLAGMYGTVGCGPLTTDCPRAEAIIAELSSQDCKCFDVVYARTLSELLKQNAAADSLGRVNAVTPGMKQQAAFLSGKEANWTFRLDRWVADKGYTAQ